MWECQVSELTWCKVCHSCPRERMKLTQIFCQPQNVLLYVKEWKCFIQKVLECLIRKCNDRYKRWAKTGVLVSCTMCITAGNTKGGKYHCTVDLLFDWFGISCMTTDNFCFYLQNRLIQTSQTGGQWYSDTSPLSIPWFLYKDLLRPNSFITTALIFNQSPNS